jgi:hypothetical protein
VKLMGSAFTGASLEYISTFASRSKELNNNFSSSCPVLYKWHFGRGPSSRTSLIAKIYLILILKLCRK